MPANAFLRNLPAETRRKFEPHLQHHRLDLNRTMVEVGRPTDHVWFPLTSLLSQITTGRSGETVETTMVGADGALGLIEALGSGRSTCTSVVQVDGGALSAPADLVRQVARDDPDFMQHAWTTAEYMLIESRQSGLCQAHHGVERRLARWLCESVERSGGRTVLPLTQEFMAAMLGVQRTTVNAFATQLQKHGLLRYSRGRVEVTDLPGLIRKSCECRDVVRENRQRLGLEVQAAG